MKDVAQRHELWLKTAAWLAQLSPTTQATYVGIIREYSAFLGAAAGTAAAATLFQQSKAVHALGYVQHVKRQKGQRPRMSRLARRTVARQNYSQCPATIAKKIMCLRRMYAVLIAHELYPDRNPFSPMLVSVPNAQGGRKRDTLAVSFEAVPAILSAVEDTPRAIRDRAVLCLLFGGALRRQEVVNLVLDDVAETPAGTTFVRLRKTKDGADHMQALPDWCADAVWLLKNQRIENGALPDDALFVQWTGKGGLIQTERAMRGAAVYHLFVGACQRAGLPPVYTPHSARATAITKLLSDGTPYREVQEFSRHKSVQMVEWYDKRRFAVDQSPAKSLAFPEISKKAS